MKLNWRSVILAVWITGIILMIHDFFIHYEYIGNIIGVIVDLTSQIARFPPHHFWVGALLFGVFFFVDFFRLWNIEQMDLKKKNPKNIELQKKDQEIDDLYEFIQELMN